MKYLFSILLTCLLAACGGGGNGDTITDHSYIFSAGNETFRIDQVGEYSIQIPSSGNNITVAANNHVTSASVTGANNALIVEGGVTIDELRLAGANNSVPLGTTVTIPQFDITGSNATVTIGAGDNIGRLFISGTNTLVTIQSLSALVPVIQIAGSNTTLRMPVGYGSHTTITNTGANNNVIEQ